MNRSKRKIQLKGEYFLADAINLMLGYGARFRTKRPRSGWTPEYPKPC